MRYCLCPVLSIIVAWLLGGCAQMLVSNPVANFTHADLQSAGQIAMASKDLLPVGDQWGACFVALAGGFEKVQTALGTKVGASGIFAEAVRLHVLHTFAQRIPTEVQTACGAVFLEIMLDAGRRLLP